MKKIIFICFLGMLFSNSDDKLITIGGSITEIVFDLGLDQ